MSWGFSGSASRRSAATYLRVEWLMFARHGSHFMAVDKIVRRPPFSMNYLGSKYRLAGDIMDSILDVQHPGGVFLDLCAGTGVVSLAAHDAGFEVVCNDVQPYATSILRGMFLTDNTGLDSVVESLAERVNNILLGGDRAHYSEILAVEENFFTAFGKAEFSQWNLYKTFVEETELVEGNPGHHEYVLVCQYFMNAYFGVRQALELDALREIIDEYGLESNEGRALMGATLATMSELSSTTTHLAQYLKPTSEKSVVRLFGMRNQSISEAVQSMLQEKRATLPAPVANEVLQLDFREALRAQEMSKADVVYLDPPYFKEHYSRYYHVLDTYLLYDYPELTQNPRINAVTVGRYRNDRIRSDFGLRSKALRAFQDVFHLVNASGATLAISYASTSIVSIHDLIRASERCQFHLHKSISFDLLHSNQGSESRGGHVEDFLLIFQPTGDSTQ